MQKMFTDWFFRGIGMVLLGTWSQSVDAQWSTNRFVNNAVSTAANDQNDPAIAGDGLGGTIITWQDDRNGNNDIYAQKFNAYGIAQWTADGVSISTAANNQTAPAIVSDGAGGAIMTWRDDRNGGYYGDIYAQRINASGVVQWTADGVVISSADFHQEYPTLVSDGSGGAIITWQDSRSGDRDIYAQRINASGVVQWTADGVVVSNEFDYQEYPTIVSDGSGGAIISWQDSRNANGDIYAQKVNAHGSMQWTSGGVAVSTAADVQSIPIIVGDGSGGAIVAWQDSRSGGYKDIYAQRINASGSVQWTGDGVSISAATYDQYSPTMVPDGSGGAIIAWRDFRNGNKDIYAQKINASGVVQWIADGVAMTTAANDQEYQSIAYDGSGGAIIAWEDSRTGYTDIYAQKINAYGVVQWSADGAAISTAAMNQQHPTMVGDASGGAMMAWSDSRSGTDNDIYVQRVDRIGNLYPAPWIDKVGDIANDQGGKLRILWRPSSLDTWGNTTVASYTVKLGTRTTGILGKGSQANGTGIYWQTAGTIPADWSEGYSRVIPTDADSGLQGRPYYYFQVIAKNADSTVLWSSNIDSGYSVDNIPPAGTGGGVIASNASGSIMLKWNRNRIDPDLMGYVVFKGSVPGFTPNSQSRFSLTTDTVFVDTTAVIGSMNYYRVAAIDKHGNVGSATSELSQLSLAVELTSFSATVSGRSVVLRWNTATESHNHGYTVERKHDAEGAAEWNDLGFIEGAGTSAVPHAYAFTDATARSGIVHYRLRQTDLNGAVHVSNSIEVKITAPSTFVLYQNYPNPFNPTTNIDFAVPVTGHAELKIYSMLGAEVATLFSGNASSGEYHQVVFDARNLSSGMYIARLTYGEQTLSKKIMLMK